MKRRLAREIVILSLYQMEMNEADADEAIDTLMSEARGENEIGMDAADLPDVDAFSRELLTAVKIRLDALDRTLSGYLTGWQVDRLSRVDRQILRLAAYELEHRTDVPPKVVINEAIEIAKRFGLEENGKFVNGVLGRMVREKGAEATQEEENS